MTNPIQVKFSNGLTVHLKEIHTAPLISHWVWYRVGSRNELPNKTGLSHWVEHMQFKGTPRYPAGILDKSISREGGAWNAMTYLDWTTYYEKLPADRIDLALDLESDRMINSIFDPQEVESERTVIISELEGNQNEPMFRLDEVIQKACFQAHPYRHEVIGEAEDLWQISREDLYNHYRTYYNPNNAVISMAGDFNAEKMLARLSQLYEGIPAGAESALHLAEDPLQSAENRLEVSGPGDTIYLRLAYRAPNASNPDFMALTVMDSLLSGPSGSFMMGGGVSNKTSRLYRALVEHELAVSVGGSLQATIDPYLYTITAIVRDGRTPDEVLVAIDDQVQRLQQERVTAEEVARAIKQAKALFAYGTENISNQAYWLGLAEMFATYDWFTSYLDRLEQVGPEDVLRVAQTYLPPERRVVGAYIPTGEEAGDGSGEEGQAE